MNPRVESIQAALEEAQLTLDELAALCGVQPRWVIERIEQGLIEVRGADFAAWRFDAATLRRARAMRGIELTFDAAPELAALVVDLTEEIERLRALLADAQRSC
ncbi:MAG: chaperone modulator CbpM [Pseudomonadota bacterium]